MHKSQVAGDARATPQPGSALGPLPVLGKPWFWLILIGTLLSFPIIKSLASDYPDAPPGHDSAPIELRYSSYDGRVGSDGQMLSTADLKGFLLVISELPIGDRDEFERGFEEWRTLKKRLKGLGFVVNYVQLVHGGSPGELRTLLEEKKAEKVSNIYLMDPERSGIAKLREAGAAPQSDFFLLDSHGRMRGTYATTPEGLTQLVFAAGVLANWRGSDPELGEAIRY